jgi:hypothetical protein
MKGMEKMEERWQEGMHEMEEHATTKQRKKPHFLEI